MRCAFIATALAALLLAACDGPAEFSAPLGPPGAAPYDERLIGRWYALEPDDNGVAILIVKAGAGEGHLDAAFGYMIVEPGAAGAAGLVSVHNIAHATVLDGQTYYSSRWVDGMMVSKEVGQPAEFDSEAMLAPRPADAYWISRATIRSDGVLLLDILSEKVPVEAGYQGQALECGEGCQSRVFNLAPGQMAELIRTTPPEDLFRIRMAFARFGSRPPKQPD